MPSPIPTEEALWKLWNNKLDSDEIASLNLHKLTKKITTGIWKKVKQELTKIASPAMKATIDSKKKK